MRNTLLAASVGLLLISLPSQSAWAITGGEVDVDNVYSNVGAIVVIRRPTDLPDLEVPRTFATGTLIHPQVLLTAAHVTVETRCTRPSPTAGSTRSTPGGNSSTPPLRRCSTCYASTSGRYSPTPPNPRRRNTGSASAEKTPRSDAGNCTGARRMPRSMPG